MTERPILFNGEMVRAILEGRKTQTRRPVKNLANRDDYTFHENKDGTWELGADTGDGYGYKLRDIHCPFGQTGDRLWVRETAARVFVPDGTAANKAVLVYRADNPKGLLVPKQWAPSIHMRRWASRILLEIVNVRVERVQDISEADAVAEGIGKDEDGFFFIHTTHPKNTLFNVSALSLFPEFWNEPYPGSWERNDWVWVIEFKKVEVTDATN